MFHFPHLTFICLGFQMKPSFVHAHVWKAAQRKLPNFVRILASLLIEQALKDFASWNSGGCSSRPRVWRKEYSQHLQMLLLFEHLRLLLTEPVLRVAPRQLLVLEVFHLHKVFVVLMNHFETKISNLYFQCMNSQNEA